MHWSLLVRYNKVSVRFLKKLAIHVTIAFFEIFKGIRGHSLVILYKKMLCFGNCSCLFQNMVDWSVSLVFSMKYAYASIAKRKIEKRQDPENCIQTSGTYRKLYKHLFVHRISSSCLLFTKFPLLSTIYVQTYSYNS